MTEKPDVKLDPTEYHFTVAEASRISGVSQNDIRNWIRPERKVVELGSKNRIGRILFSALDIVQLRVIGDLNKLLSTEPSVSAFLARDIATHCHAWLYRDNKQLHVDEKGYRRETRLLVHLDDDGDSTVTPFAWGSSVIGFKIPERGTGQDWARRPMLILPVEQIFTDVLEELWSLLEQEQD